MRKSTSRTPAMRVKLISAAVSACFASAGAFANPTGVISSSGVVSMANPAPNVLEITNNPGAIINWQSFSISAGELTRFIQNSASSAVLNRVMGPTQSDIMGALTSNGRVFLINPNGILFGSGAVVDVAGLVASSLNLSDADFLDGNFRFQAVPGAGDVSNHGTLRTSSGGPIYLVGPAVTNGGLIDNPGGEVILAAGNSVELMSPGTPGLSVSIAAPDNQAINVGHIIVDSGRLGMFAGVINQGGSVAANSAVVGADGSIRLVATDSTTFASGSNTAGGPLDIETGDLVVAGAVTTGQQNIRAAGGVKVDNGSLNAANGQTIEAGYLEVNATAGGFASISNTGGTQHISTTSANAAGEGLAVRSDGGVAGITSFLGDQWIDVRNADRLTVDGLSGVAQIVNIDGVQSVAVTGTGANALQLGASGGPGQSVIGGGGFQSILAGNPGEQGSISIIGPNSGIPSNPVFGGTQTVGTTGALSVIGGSAFGLPGSGISANGINGLQTIRAESILLQGGPSGSGNTAGIFANSGSQFIDAGAGGITMKGGAGGGNNFAHLFQGSTNPADTQTVRSAGPVHLEAGSGNFNFAMIRSFGGHQSLDFGGTTLLAGATGVDNFVSVQGRAQDIVVHGDLAVTGRGSAGTPAAGGGVRIGGASGGAPSSTDLRLTVEGDLTLTAGHVPGANVSIGNNVNVNGPTAITVNAWGDVTLNGGSAPNTFATIGSRATNPTGGDIAITAGGTIALNSTALDQATAIRTMDSVALTAQQITQGPDARIEAGSLSVLTQQGAALTGQNAIGSLNLSNQFFGDVAFNNASALLTVTQALNIPGALSLQQAGDMLVIGHVSSGAQTIDVSGGLRVENAPFSFSQIGANGGQTINAGHVEVIGNVGGSASIFNFGGEQRVATLGANAAGEGLAVRAFDSGFATIDSPFGPQSIEVRNADRMAVDGISGFATVTSFGGSQSISVTGSGANELVLGSPGAAYQSLIAADDQTIRAGNASERGSITVHGTSNGAFGTALILTFQGAGGNQTVSTSGALSVLGGAAPGNSATGIFANQAGGHQTVVADSIVLQAGDTGSGNSAMIGANTGSQTIHAGVGGITLRGGEAGGNNFAMINQAAADSAATQSIVSAGPVLLAGGSGNFNFAMIRAFGGHQAFEAGDTTLLAGASGVDNFANIQGRSQDVTVHGDLEIRARGSAGSPTVGGGARIGGTGGALPAPTDLRLNVAGNLTMTAGDVSGTGALLGNSTIFTGPADISVNAGGNVTLNGGSVPNAFATIGSRTGSLAGGDISIASGGTIALNSTSADQASIIRTTDAATLSAQQIVQGTDARIEAGNLSTMTFSGADLDGANALNAFSAVNFGGDLVLHNTSALLTVTQVDNFGNALTLRQMGELLVNGLVFSGVQSVDVSGGLVVRNEPGGFAQLIAQGGQSIDAGFVEVNAVAGGGASIFSIDGPQSIATSGANAAGESIAVRSSGGFFAEIAGFGSTQSIMLTGGGPNALVVGDPGFGSARIGGDSQSIVAGNPGESGSITIAGSGSQIASNFVPGGTQTISTSGSITVFGGTAPFGPPAGVFHHGSGMQSVSAQSIHLQGGSAGANNGAQINALNGPQSVQVGTIEMYGGADGINNTAILRSGPGLQTIVADQIDVTGGAGGTQNFAVIVSPQQDVTVHGDLTLSGGGSLPGTFGGGALMGGGSTAPTDLTLIVGGNVTLNGGSVPVAGAGIGAGSAGGQRTDIVMSVAGDVTLNPGAVTGTRIGSPEENRAGGNIFVDAGGTIALNSAGPGNAGSIFTNDTVALNAQRIAQGANSRIEAASLSAKTTQGAMLGGANSVSALSMLNSASGDVAFNNASALLTVTGIDQVLSGALSLSQTGDLLINGNVTSGAQTIGATGDMSITPGIGPNVTVQAHGTQTFNVGGTFSLLGGADWNGYAQTLASGPVSITTGDDLIVRAGSGLLAYALLYGSGNIHLTVGDELRIDGGSWPGAFARVQAGFWDRIFLNFPNRDSGGYFVDGHEGMTIHGLDGFFTGLRPAIRNHSLVLSYGE